MGLNTYIYFPSYIAGSHSKVIHHFYLNECVPT